MRGVGRPSMQRIVGRPTTKQVPLPSSPTVALRSTAGDEAGADRKAMKCLENFSDRLLGIDTEREFLECPNLKKPLRKLTAVRLTDVATL